jgi:hypothetical protein
MFIALIPFAFAKNDLQEVTSEFQEWSSKLGGQLVVGTTGPQAYKLALRVQKLDNALPMHIQPLPVVGNIDKDLIKAMRAHRSRCGLHLEIIQNQWTITPFGECAVEDRVLKVSEDGDIWRIKDEKGRLVSAMSYSLLVGDEDLQELLRDEQNDSLTRQRALMLGSGLTALASFFPLVQMQPGLPPASVDRLWTTAYLLSTSGMLLAAKQYPQKALKEQQISLGNYMTIEMAEEGINRRWPTTEEESEEVVEPPAIIGEEGAEDASEDMSSMADEEGQDSSGPLPPPTDSPKEDDVPESEGDAEESEEAPEAVLIEPEGDVQ